MLTIMKALHKLQSNSDDKTAEAHVDKLYKALDKNKDGELTRDEFIKLGNTDPELMDLVCGFSQK